MQVDHTARPLSIYVDAMKVLVATDGSRAGLAALRFASSLLAGRDDELVVLAVYGSAAKAGSGIGGLERFQARRVLDDAARVLGRAGASPARFELLLARASDDVPEVICRQADRTRAGLIVVGSEGRDSLAEWVVGGTALRLIYLSRRPVTVVRPPRRRTSVRGR